MSLVSSLHSCKPWMKLDFARGSCGLETEFSRRRARWDFAEFDREFAMRLSSVGGELIHCKIPVKSSTLLAIAFVQAMAEIYCSLVHLPPQYAGQEIY